MDFHDRPLGRRKRNQDADVKKFPFKAIQSTTVETVEKTLTLPTWHKQWDQGSEGACVGFGTSMMMSILNRRRYDPWWLWREARLADEWSGNDDMSVDEGTWVNAACQILYEKGHRRFYRGKSLEVDPQHGVSWYRWATSVDEVRTALSQGIPCSIGVTWYSNFDTPKQKGNEWWIGEGHLGAIRGGHSLCLYGASDRRQAFKLKNSWGGNYPLVYIPYTTMQTLLDEWGEVVLVTDR